MMMRSATSRPRANRRASPRAFTLVEMVISLVIVSILMVGMGGALLMSSQALPGEDGQAARITAAAEVADQIASELAYAITVTELTPTAITFTVADRDADSDPETIRYAWSATAGDPLTRRYNGGTTVTVAENVHGLTLTGDLRTETEPLPPVISEGGESVLASRDLLTSSADFPITTTDWIGQYFLPALPAEATQWRVTRVLFMARANGKTQGETKIQLRTADASGLPTASVLAEFILAESALGATYSWREYAVTGVSGLAAGDGLCLVLTNGNTRPPMADIQYDSAGGGNLLTAASGESSWSKSAGRSMRFYVYGMCTTSVSQPDETTNWLRGVSVSLQIGPDATVRVETAARVLNQPEVKP